MTATAASAAPPKAGRAAEPARRVLLLTEGTYPFAVGGVSTWCDLLLRGMPDVEWEVFALTAGAVGQPVFQLPQNAWLSAHMRLWGPSEGSHRPGDIRPRVRRTRRPTLAAALVEGLFGWCGDPHSVVEALVWCREHPDQVVPTFREAETWDRYVVALTGVLNEVHDDVGHTPTLDLNRAIELYQTMSWVARTASAQTPVADVSMVTTAGWSAIPAVVDKALFGVPLVLVEHGLYVREAYLAGIRSADSPAGRFVNTRLARGLTRLSYRAADVVTPVTPANVPWEEWLGVAKNRILAIPNGVPASDEPTAPPGTRTVVSVGRFDPLKDIATMLRVAAAVRRRVPDVTFLHYGPVPAGQEDYHQTCQLLHQELHLEGTFHFMGPTHDPTGVMREADVVLMTSISEGFPMSILEALSQGRPVVTTLVGGVLDAMQGAGITVPPGDVYGVADAVTTLLADPDLAATLGRRGHARVNRLFGQQRCIDAYRALIRAVALPTQPSQLR